MINKPKNYEGVQAYTQTDKLPIGGYVLEILNVKVESTQYGDKIVLGFDIKEGDQAGFYKKNLAQQTQEDRKWKGNYRLSIPKDDGTEEDGKIQRRFKTVMDQFEDSNSGFHWAWDEQALKGKLIGGIFNNKEYDFNGRNGFFTNCYALTSVENIRSGNFTIPPDTLLKKSGFPAGFEQVDDEEFIPF